MKIFHICNEDSWKAQSSSKTYAHPSLQEEGFIHCSEDHQVEGVLERYFKGQKNLIVLTIDPALVNPKIQYDKAPIGEDYPHIYGHLNKNAIVEVRKIRTHP